MSQTTAPGPDASPQDGPAAVPLDVSVVVPVYCGARTLRDLTAEIGALREPQLTPGGTVFRVCELILVWDHGPDESDLVIEQLASEHDWVRAVWLSRNFGQHPATVAGMSSSRGDWVVTMDEDGQHRPADIADLIDVAYRTRSALVYAAPTNRPPHSAMRNAASALTKGVVLRALSGRTSVPFHSFRLIHGEHARAVAAFCGPGVYLDIALGWVVGATASCPVEMRTEGRRATSYNLHKLVSHFWHLVISSGDRPLRIVSGLGLVTSALGVVLSILLVVQRIVGTTQVEGWTSAIVATLLTGGVILISLGVIAEYIGLAASMSMGRPLFVSISSPFPATPGPPRPPA